MDATSALAMWFPRLRVRGEQASGAGYGEAPGHGEAPDNGADHGLDTILDGIERRLQSTVNGSYVMRSRAVPATSILDTVDRTMAGEPDTSTSWFCQAP